MKIIFSLVFSLTFIFFHTYAQQAQSAYTSQIDSVQTLLNTSSKSDTLRVIELNQLARLCIYALQYERGLTAAIEARALARNLNYAQGEGMYLRTLDVLHYDKGIGEPYHILTYWSFADLKKAESLMSIPSPSKVDQVKRNKELAIASKALEENGNKEMAAHCYHLLAFNYLEEKDNEKAIKSIEKAEHTFVNLGLGIPIMEAKILKAKILKKAGKELEVQKEELQMTQISEMHEDERERALMYNLISYYYFFIKENRVISVDYALKCVQILEAIGEKYLLAKAYYLAGATFHFLSFTQKSVEYLGKSFDLINTEKINDNWLSGFYKFYPSRLIEAGEFEKAERIIAVGKSILNEESYGLTYQGLLLMTKGQYSEALELFYKRNEMEGIERGEPGNHSWRNYNVAFCLSRLGKLNESNRFAIKGFQHGNYGNRNYEQQKIVFLLYENYKNLGQLDKALEYLGIYTEWVQKDKLQDVASRASNLEIQGVINKSAQEKRQLEKEKMLQDQANQTQRWWIFSIAAGLFSSLVVVLLLVRNNKNKQKANKLLEQQKGEINTQKNKAEKSLDILKSTQAQLILSEKMASLGELTAGIAHEIQNPLNFVNNFSEVSNELLDEMNEELDQGEIEEAKSIAVDIKQNLEKINLHGQRASSIVKGMLEHSRTGDGKKEPTDINKLADEYLRLAYHGLRAKDKNFNCKYETNFQEDLPKINVVPQDVGRVILNLINNAFHAISSLQPSVGSRQSPIVKIKTELCGVNDSMLTEASVQISISDNGPGIPDNIVDKIFHPFFTTKPSGQGTGLGLSLAYDIVKAHGGDLKMEQGEGNETKFVIELPYQS